MNCLCGFPTPGIPSLSRGDFFEPVKKHRGLVVQTPAIFLKQTMQSAFLIGDSAYGGVVPRHLRLRRRSPRGSKRLAQARVPHCNPAAE